MEASEILVFRKTKLNVEFCRVNLMLWHVGQRNQWAFGFIQTLKSKSKALKSKILKALVTSFAFFVAIPPAFTGICGRPW